ncbi:MAG: DUF3256 family protein [Bacteroidaceae bacterium]|nr:DUF3256 family protein [Bacteroidaceae bacterium]
MKKYFLALTALFVTLNSSGATDMRTLFKEMPDSILPLLTQSNRLDMLDFVESRMKAVVRNRLDGESELVSISDCSLQLKYTTLTDIAIRLYYYRDMVPLICVVHSVGDGLRDSRISFFDSHWNPVDESRLISKPVFEDFIAKGLPKDTLSILGEVSEVRGISIVPVEGGLEFIYSGNEYLSRENEKLKKYIIETPLIYSWNGRRFVLSKKAR